MGAAGVCEGSMVGVSGTAGRVSYGAIMRTITIPQAVIDRAAHGPITGVCLEFAVAVNWPELQLTEEQMIANVLARLDGYETPYPDQSIFSVTVPWATPKP
jgi:hypothetical protein